MQGLMCLVNRLPSTSDSEPEPNSMSGTTASTLEAFRSQDGVFRDARHCVQIAENCQPEVDGMGDEITYANFLNRKNGSTIPF